MRFVFIKALFGLLMYDILGFGHHFGRVHKFVSGTKTAARTPSPDAVRMICDAVNYACVVYPKPVLCLQRSTVTTYLLRRCGAHAQMVIGAQKLPFKAHAWTEVNGHAVNERRDVQKIYGVWERC